MSPQWYISWRPVAVAKISWPSIPSAHHLHAVVEEALSLWRRGSPVANQIEDGAWRAGPRHQLQGTSPRALCAGQTRREREGGRGSGGGGVKGGREKSSRARSLISIDDQPAHPDLMSRVPNTRRRSRPCTHAPASVGGNARAARCLSGGRASAEHALGVA